MRMRKGASALLGRHESLLDRRGGVVERATRWLGVLLLRRFNRLVVGLVLGYLLVLGYFSFFSGDGAGGDKSEAWVE
jgi:hypothetical protein